MVKSQAIHRQTKNMLPYRSWQTQKERAHHIAPLPVDFLLVRIEDPVFVLWLFVPLIGMNPGPKVHIRPGYPVEPIVFRQCLFAAFL